MPVMSSITDSSPPTNIDSRGINNFIKSNIDVGCLNVAHINLNGIPTIRKFDEFKFHLSDCQFDVVAVSETHLSFHQQFAIGGYKIERCDRRGGYSHGGVCMHIKDGIKTRRLACTADLSTCGTVEYLFFELILPSAIMFIGVIYNPPCVTLSSI